jgi:hypothetical protein
MNSLLNLNPFDLVFVVTAVIFNLLIASIFIAVKHDRGELVRRFGLAVMATAVPFAAAFFHTLQVGSDPFIKVYFGFIFLYLITELLLDFVLKIDFRNSRLIHIPYIFLEYLALFAMIAIAFSIHSTWGYIVSISFWILMACLIYLYWDKIIPSKRESYS